MTARIPAATCCTVAPRGSPVPSGIAMRAHASS